MCVNKYAKAMCIYIYIYMYIYIHVVIKITRQRYTESYMYLVLLYLKICFCGERGGLMITRRVIERPLTWSYPNNKTWIRIRYSTTMHAIAFLTFSIEFNLYWNGFFLFFFMKCTEMGFEDFEGRRTYLSAS